MARPDLPDGYDGWQALDATPQEETEEECKNLCICCDRSMNVHTVAKYRIY